MPYTTVIRKGIRHLSNLPGWRTQRKIVVIESDDWGSIRMPSMRAFERLKAKGLDLVGGDSERYNRYDTLAGEDDLYALFRILESVKDSNGNHAVFTPVVLVANPDFTRIAANYFQEYYYEPFTKTLARYHGHQRTFALWKTGISNRLFVPQFHGREHLNVSEWLRALRGKDPATTAAFEEGMWGFNNTGWNGSQVSYQAAFDIYELADLSFQQQAIIEGLGLFEQLFGYAARFFVPPNGPFNNGLEATASEHGIKYMSSAKIQLEPLGNGKIKKRLHYMGQRNAHGQLYLTRNCIFEPSQHGKDWVDSCLNDVRSAFLWKKPAVISSHRVNYIGAHDIKNRKQGLEQLGQLLKIIVKEWPEVEFMTSQELGDLITGN
jgi:hypothetical protein